jgi:hypothetical protein
MLDGYTVEIGNTIWDILLERIGTVIAVDGGGLFTVSFTGGKVLTYTSGGSIAGARRAYWLNPVLTLPQKNDAQWACIQAVVNAMRSC